MTGQALPVLDAGWVSWLMARGWGYHTQSTQAIAIPLEEDAVFPGGDNIARDPSTKNAFRAQREPQPMITSRTTRFAGKRRCTHFASRLSKIHDWPNFRTECWTDFLASETTPFPVSCASNVVFLTLPPVGPDIGAVLNKCIQSGGIERHRGRAHAGCYSGLSQSCP